MRPLEEAGAVVGSHEGIWLWVRWVQREGRIREGCLLPETRGTVRAVAIMLVFLTLGS